jgi:hypothetical protein
VTIFLYIITATQQGITGNVRNQECDDIQTAFLLSITRINTLIIKPAFKINISALYFLLPVLTLYQ